MEKTAGDSRRLSSSLTLGDKKRLLYRPEKQTNNNRIESVNVETQVPNRVSKSKSFDENIEALKEQVERAIRKADKDKMCGTDKDTEE